MRYETKETPSAEVNNRDSHTRWKSILKTFIKVYIISFSVFLIIASFCLIGMQTLLDKVEYATEEDMIIPDNLDSLYIEPEAGEELAGANTFTDEDMAAAEEQLDQIIVHEDNLRHEKGVTNILLLGTDGRKANSKNVRSDVIIILSINDNTKKIVMSSIMRDTYVHIPGRKDNEKITHAHFYGGPALTIQTIEKNFGIRIDHFVSVNFYSFMDIVDALGGVDVPVHDNDYKIINSYIAEINRQMNLDSNDGFLNETGDSVHLTGKQAMGFVRNRYSGNGDYSRSDRQRMVLEQLIAKAREADYQTLIDTANSVADDVYTDLTSQRILLLAMNAIKYKDYELVQFRVPDESTEYVGGVYKGHWVLRIDMEANRELLANAIYEE